MKALVKRTVIVTLLAGIVMVHGLEAVEACAAYISSGSGDEPLTGWLIGEQTITQTTVRTFGTTGGFRTATGSASYTTTTSRSYSVGTYEMSDGTRRQVRCDSYQYV